MSSPRMIARRRQTVYMAHTCSTCGFPTISIVQINAESQRSYSILQSEAERIASETVENTIQTEIEKIESCYITKKPLVGKHKGNGMISPGYFCTWSIIGFASRCPKCLSIEPWQSSSSKKKMTELTKDNFPVVFEEAEEAEEWAIEQIKDMLSEINLIREIPHEVAQAVKIFKEQKAKLLIWTHEIESLPEQVKYDELSKELAAAKKQKANLGILDIRAKKIVNDRINTLEPQLRKLKEDLDEKADPIARKIVDTGNALLAIQAMAFGYEDKISNINKGNTFSYHFSPKDVPADIMEEIESYADQAISGVQHVNSTDTVSFAEPASNDDIVFCRKCGFKLLPGSAFCSKCGSKTS